MSRHAIRPASSFLRLSCATGFDMSIARLKPRAPTPASSRQLKELRLARRIAVPADAPQLRASEHSFEHRCIRGRLVERLVHDDVADAEGREAIERGIVRERLHPLDRV